MERMLALTLAAAIAVFTARVSAQPPLDQPVTIEVTRDVPVTSESPVTVQRGKLYLEGPTSAKPFLLKKGDRFQMIAIGREGSCRIRFKGRELAISSCPWVEGFADSQSDIFHVVSCTGRTGRKV